MDTTPVIPVPSECLPNASLSAVNSISKAFCAWFARENATLMPRCLSRSMLSRSDSSFESPTSMPESDDEQDSRDIGSMSLARVSSNDLVGSRPDCFSMNAGEIVRRPCLKTHLLKAVATTASLPSMLSTLDALSRRLISSWPTEFC